MDRSPSPNKRPHVHDPDKKPLKSILKKRPPPVEEEPKDLVCVKTNFNFRDTSDDEKYGKKEDATAGAGKVDANGASSTSQGIDQGFSKDEGPCASKKNRFNGQVGFNSKMEKIKFGGDDSDSV